MLSGRLLKAIIAYPLTWVVTGSIAAFEWSFAAWFEPPPAVLGGALGVGLLSAGLWVGLLASSSAFRARIHHRSIEQARAGPRKIAPLQLRAELERVGSAQGIAQLDMLTQKRDALVAVLKRRLDTGELTYSRYLGTAEQVYLSTLDNLHDIAVALTGAGGMDRGYIEQRLSELERSDASSPRTNPSSRREQDTLEQRRSLLDQQLERIAALFAQNEAAMTALDNTTAALAKTRMGTGQAGMGAEQAMLALEELAARTSGYAATDG